VIRKTNCQALREPRGLNLSVARLGCFDQHVAHNDKTLFHESDAIASLIIFNNSTTRFLENHFDVHVMVT